MKRFKRLLSLKRLGQEEDGQAMVLFALLLVVLLGFAALVVDVGLMTASKSKLQNAADAAALAGALEAPPLFANGSFSGDPATIENKIRVSALEYAAKNGVPASNTSVTWSIVDSDPDPDPDKVKWRNEVKVDVSEAVQHQFARVLGFNNTTIEATATAARYAVRAGSVVPLINLNNQPVGGYLEIRDKDDTNTSDREWIDITYYMTQQGVTQIEDLIIDARETLEVEKGGTQVWMDYVETLLLYPGPHFIFSIDFDIIAQLPTGSGIGIFDKDGNPSTGLLLKNGKLDSLNQHARIAPFVSLVGGKYIPCTLPGDHDDHGCIPQIIIAELKTGSLSGGSGANMVVSGPYVAEHNLEEFYENKSDDETELGESKSRLVK